MRRKTTIIITVCLILALASFSYADASCVETSLQENYDRADIVVRGTAISAEKSLFKGEYFDFSVDTYFKGEGSSHIKVTGKQDKNAETSVDFQLEEGKRYLLFLRGDADSILKTDACSGSRENQGALSRGDIVVLGRGEAPHQEASKPDLISGRALALVSVIVLAGVGGAIFVSRKELHKEHQDHIE